MKFKKVLIANRGEIALRIIRACREMNISSAIIYSEADRQSLPVLLADEAHFVGPSPSSQSYLNIPKILEILKTSKADAIHPGYGFLSENALFAKQIEKSGVTFIGPSSQAISLMGDKIKARQIMQNAGVPLVPGSDGKIRDLKHLKILCRDIGFPVILKAALGGGGKGMRVVYGLDDLEIKYQSAKSEALNAFANDDLYVEKFIQNPKHIEIQVFADGHGNALYLYERECSIQRRHQKLIEEALSPTLPANVRQKMGELAVKATKAINYRGAGTFEFIFDGLKKEFFFMEMNTRLQVEHPVTEMLTGIDLVKEQITVASGQPLSFDQKDIQPKGHAIEVRVCGEDPKTYIPSPGKIIDCLIPQGPFVRWDSFVVSSNNIPIHYDNLIGKLVAWGRHRKEAIERLQRALAETHFFGIQTNILLLRQILKTKPFQDGSYTTDFLDKNFEFEVISPQKTKEQHAFLIPAVIEAYEAQKTSYQKTSNRKSQWRQQAPR